MLGKVIVFSLQAAIQTIPDIFPRMCDLTTVEPRNRFLQLLCKHQLRYFLTADELQVS